MSFQTQQVKLPNIADNRERVIPDRTRSRTLNQLNSTQESPQSNDKFKNSCFAIKNQPFKLPTDNEVFDYCEQQKFQKMENKREQQKQQIWNKFTQISQRPLKLYKQFEDSVQINEKHQTKTPYRSLDKNNIQAALEIIKEREFNKDSSIRKEPVTQVLEQKKEMFLVTMAYGIIEQENKALVQSRLMLEQDQQNFTKYMEQNQLQLKNADEKADKMSKIKRDKENIIKQLTIQLTQIKADKMKNEENLTQYLYGKTFLENMANKEWLDNQKVERDNFISKYKQNWLQEQVNIQVQDNLNDSFKKPIINTKDNKANHKKQQQLTDELETRFQQQLENNEFSEITEFIDKQDMFFKEPDQLAIYFNTLEEKNLILIQSCQEEGQRYQELKNKFQEETQRLNEKCRFSQQQRDGLRKQIDEITEDIRQLKRKGDTNKNIIMEEATDLNKLIQEMHTIFIGDTKNQSENNSTENAKQLLTQIEICLENQIKSIKDLLESNPNLVREQQKKAELERKSQMRKEQIRKLQEEQQIKEKKNNQKILMQNKKNNGRYIMERSAPLQKQEKVVEKIINNQDFEDKKYFDPGFNLTINDKNE